MDHHRADRGLNVPSCRLLQLPPNRRKHLLRLEEGVKLATCWKSLRSYLMIWWNTQTLRSAASLRAPPGPWIERHVPIITRDYFPQPRWRPRSRFLSVSSFFSEETTQAYLSIFSSILLHAPPCSRSPPLLSLSWIINHWRWRRWRVRRCSCLV